MPSLDALPVQYLPLIEERLKLATKSACPSVQTVMDHLWSARGKRLRPLLCIASAMCFGDVTDAVLDVACAIELVHAASLVHDDIIDGSRLRRGIPTVNALWGGRIAVLTGDVLLARALTILTPYATVGVMETVSRAVSRMCESEIEQEQSAFDTGVSEEQYLRRIEGKTAALLEAACLVGASVSGAPAILLQHCGHFGRSLGIAFQIADDILDFTGDSGDLGKPVCSDLRQGIVTLPAIYLLADCKRGSYLVETIMRRLVGKRIRRILRDLVDTGALARSAERGIVQLDSAREHLSNLPGAGARVALGAALGLIEDRLWGKERERQVLLSLAGGLHAAGRPQSAAEQGH